LGKVPSRRPPPPFPAARTALAAASTAKYHDRATAACYVNQLAKVTSPEICALFIINFAAGERYAGQQKKCEIRAPLLWFRRSRSAGGTGGNQELCGTADRRGGLAQRTPAPEILSLQSARKPEHVTLTSPFHIQFSSIFRLSARQDAIPF